MSMETILIILLVIVLLGLGLVLYVLTQKLNEVKNTSAVELVKGDVTELSRTIAQLSQTMGDKLERSSLGVQQSVQKQLTESAKLVADVTQRLAKLDETNRRVVDVADELKTLQNVLSNPKQRGVFGEVVPQSQRNCLLGMRIECECLRLFGAEHTALQLQAALRVWRQRFLVARARGAQIAFGRDVQGDRGRHRFRKPLR